MFKIDTLYVEIVKNRRNQLRGASKLAFARIRYPGSDIISHPARALFRQTWSLQQRVYQVGKKPLVYLLPLLAFK